MSSDPQLFRVNPESRETHQVNEVEFAALGFRERQDIQEWVAANPAILGDGLLVVGKEFSGFDRTNERLDLLAVDQLGTLVVIELKRDDSGADVHWQAIKYASYLRGATGTQIVAMLAKHEEVSEDEAEERLRRHLGADELSGLNHDQRIILASHRFAPEVTSAVLWLNEKTPGDGLITCVTLTPFRDPETHALYLQANTIIPVPGAEDYAVGIGNGAMNGRRIQGHSSNEKLRRSMERNRNDAISRFCWDVAERVLQRLPAEVRPEKTSLWAGSNGPLRYFGFWYSRLPWANHSVNYFLHILPSEDPVVNRVEVNMNLYDEAVEGIVLKDASAADIAMQKTGNAQHGYTLARREGALDDACAQWITDELCRAIEAITPIVDAVTEQDNETDAQLYTGGPP